ncbi:MAG: hypothetical protein PVI41_08325 [Roseobacter sp.]
MIGIGDLHGHWRRAWIKAPGFEDTTTHVHWMQCGAYYADVRIPDGLPDISGARSLSDLDPETLRTLMQAEGFAGTISVENDVCTWARRINWHGKPDAVDAGKMSFDADGALIEDGVHADYRELWVRQPHAPLEALGCTADGQEIFLMSSETAFVLAVGATDTPASRSLVSALDEGKKPAGLEAHFSCFYVFGRWEGLDGIALLGTNPLMTGDTVLSRSEQDQRQFRLAYRTYDGSWQSKELAFRTLDQACPQRSR